MNESEKSDRGVIIAVTLLQLFCAPFIFVTAILALLIGFAPFLLAINETVSVGEMPGVLPWLFGYGIMMFVLVVFYSVSKGMMMMAEMIKENHLLGSQSKSSKSMLFEFIGELMALISLELIVGGIFGAIVIVVRSSTLMENLFITEISYFLLVLLITGIGCLWIRKSILRLEWWGR